jgi:catechol 2,3-dioxygenase-like lactoylglutathione lyase family enzyme
LELAARFAHVSLVALDWRRLAAFYEQVFGCVPVPPQRQLSGPWLEAATGIPRAEIRGMHLRLPGCDGPTLEIFQYAPEGDGSRKALNRPGFAHIAFAVEDVARARDAVLKAGGGELGPVTSRAIPGAGNITFVYLTDPEGNALELQRWE